MKTDWTHVERRIVGRVQSDGPAVCPFQSRARVIPRQQEVRTMTGVGYPTRGFFSCKAKCSSPQCPSLSLHVGPMKPAFVSVLALLSGRDQNRSQSRTITFDLADWLVIEPRHQPVERIAAIESLQILCGLDESIRFGNQRHHRLCKSLHLLKLRAAL